MDIEDTLSGTALDTAKEAGHTKCVAILEGASTRLSEK